MKKSNFVQIPRIVLQASRKGVISSDEFRLYAYLVEESFGGKTVSISASKTAEEMGITRKYASKLIKSLASKKLIANTEFILISIESMKVGAPFRVKLIDLWQKNHSFFEVEVEEKTGPPESHEASQPESQEPTNLSPRNPGPESQEPRLPESSIDSRYTKNTVATDEKNFAESEPSEVRWFDGTGCRLSANEYDGLVSEFGKKHIDFIINKIERKKSWITKTKSHRNQICHWARTERKNPSSKANQEGAPPLCSAPPPNAPAPSPLSEVERLFPASGLGYHIRARVKDGKISMSVDNKNSRDLPETTRVFLESDPNWRKDLDAYVIELNEKIDKLKKQESADGRQRKRV